MNILNKLKSLLSGNIGSINNLTGQVEHLEGEELKKYVEENKHLIEATEKESISITPVPEENLTLTQSKFGGVPYLPKNEEYPKDECTGKPFHFIVQINFDEVPELEGYPDRGILQFFIRSLWDERGHKIRYYKEILSEDKLTEDIAELKDLNPEESPILKKCKLEFAKQKEYVSMNDYRYEETLPEEFRKKIGFMYSDIEKITGYDISGMGSKIGGYAFSTQSYHRYDQVDREYDEILLQIDSKFSDLVMWADGGVGVFFIKAEDLKNCDFTDTLFSWNCY